MELGGNTKLATPRQTDPPSLTVPERVAQGRVSYPLAEIALNTVVA